MTSPALHRFFAPLLWTAALLLNVSAPLHAQTVGSTLPSAQSDRVTARVDAGARVALKGHRPAWLSGASDLGAIPDAQTVQLNLGMTRSAAVQAAFDQLTADQQTPGSPRFHQWLTPAQVGAQFGPTQHDLDAVTTWLTAAGLHVDGIQANRLVVQVSGSAAIVSAVFGTSLHTYTHAAGTAEAATVQAPVSEPLVPQALAPVIQYVGGLTDVPRHTHMVVTAPTPNTATNIGRRAPENTLVHPNVALGGGYNWIGPNDFALLYDLTPLYTASVKGSGQKVMIIGGSRLNPQDLSYWESLSGLGAYAPNYIVGPTFTDPGQTNDGNQGEGTLDFERVYGTAPGATVDQVIGLNWLSGTVSFNLISYAINTVNDPILSMSFGSCEVMEPAGYVQQESALYQQAAAQGISVFASSGDSGVDGCENHAVAAQATQVASISDICASPYVTCVGGTEFNDTTNTASYWSTTNGTGLESAIRYIPEGAWNEPVTTNAAGTVTGYAVNATGGGFSTLIPKPSWQVGTGVPADGVRDVPDVSFTSSQHNAFFSCLAYAGAGGNCVPNAQGSFGLVGFAGTSASAPAMAGIAALLNQKLGGKQGNINPLLYKVFNSAAGATAFHDATIANSGVSGCTVATPSQCNNSDPAPATLTGGLAGYALQTGFDEATGLGSLDVANFVAAAAAAGNITLPTFILTPTNPTLTLASSLSASGMDVVTLTTTSGYAGTVSLSCTALLNSGVAQVSPGCSVNPSSVAYPATTQATVTITTVAPHAVSGKGFASAEAPGGLAGLAGAVVGMAGVLGLCLPGMRRRFHWRALAAMLLLTGALTGLAGCGGKTVSPAPVPSGGTTTGNYTVTVTGTSSTGSPTVTTSFSLTVN